MTKNSRHADTNAPKIACFLPTLSGGGAEKNTLTLMSMLAGRGYTVDLVLGRRRGPYINQVPSNVRVVELRKGSRLAGWLTAARAFPRDWGLFAGAGLWRRHAMPQLRSLPALVRYLRREQPAILMTQMWYCNFAGAWARAVARVRSRLITVDRNALMGTAVIGSNTVTRPPVFYRLMARLYTRAAARVTVSDGLADDLAATTGLARTMFQTIYNPVVDTDLAARADAQPPHHWCRSDGPPVLLAVGRLAPQKGFDTLIEAFARVRQHRRARLVIFGEGGDRPLLAERIAALGLHNDVDMPGWVDNPYATMARADVFVLSSRYEGLPTALIEALACGCPVVATDCPSGPHEILQDGRYGTLVPVGDAPALAEAIEHSLDKPGNRAGRIRRAGFFSVERSVACYEQLLKTLLENEQCVARAAALVYGRH